MAKVIHVQGSDNSGSSMLMAVVLLIIFFIFFFYWGLPILKSVTQQQNGGINIQVPDTINVNVTGQPSQ